MIDTDYIESCFSFRFRTDRTYVQETRSLHPGCSISLITIMLAFPSVFEIDQGKEFDNGSNHHVDD